MSKKIPWVAFFSQTGTEICDISKALGRAPDIVVTNAPEEKINEGIYNLGSLLYRVPDRPSTEQYFQVIPREMETIITLHGWLRIIPEEVCEAYAGRIFNGHPALITDYPELKGKDKQEEILIKKEKYPWIGSVIHKVTAELDAGEILYSCRRQNTAETIEDAYRLLRGPSFQTWVRCMRDYLQNSEQDKQQSVHWVYREELEKEISAT
jgi:folate-dependent phosphoribosylglycinamide formyltransferase PurN